MHIFFYFILYLNIFKNETQKLTIIFKFKVQQIQIPQQQIVQQQVVQPQQYAVVQDNSMSNGTRQIYFVGSNSNTSNEVVVDEAQNQQQPILLNHQIGHNNTVRLRTPIQQLPVRGNTSLATGSGVRQQLVQVIIGFYFKEIPQISYNFIKYFSIF